MTSLERNNHMKKIIILTRVSTAKQMQGNSIDDQIEQGMKFAQDKQMEVAEVVKIQASGRKQLLNIGQLAETMKRAKEIDADVVCTKVDRLSRDQISLLMLRSASKESGVEVHVLSMGRKMSEISDIEWSCLAMLASEERKLIVERTRRAAQNRIGPIGQELDPRELARKSIEKRVELAKAWAMSVKLKERILEAVDALKVPNLKNVARYLNGEGMVTRRGGRWDGSNLHKQINRLGWNWKELSK